MKGTTAVMLSVVLVVGACGDDSDQAVSNGTFCDTIRRLAEAAITGGVGVDIDSSMSEAEQQAAIREAGAGLRAMIDEALVLFDELEARAPDEISADVALVVGDHREMYGQMRVQADDFLGALDVTTSFQHREGVPAAIERIDRHSQEQCGVGFTLGGEVLTGGADRPARPAPPPPPTPPTPPPPPNPYGGG